MAFNPAEETFDSALIRNLKQLRTDMDQLKGQQRIGGDNTTVEATLIFGTFGSVAAGTSSDIPIVFTPTNNIVGLAELVLTLYIDNNNVAAYKYPMGASLSADQKLFDVHVFQDRDGTSATTGVKTWYIRITSRAAAAHFVYLTGQVYSIKNPASTPTAGPI